VDVETSGPGSRPAARVCLARLRPPPAVKEGRLLRGAQARCAVLEQTGVGAKGSCAATPGAKKAGPARRQGPAENSEGNRNTCARITLRVSTRGNSVCRAPDRHATIAWACSGLSLPARGTWAMDDARGIGC
jgi:hypothetical protein